MQKLLNEQGRRVTGCFRTIPQGELMNDAGLRPAKSLLKYRVQWYKLRQMMMADGQGGGTMLEKRGNGLQMGEGIDELILEEYLEWKSYESTTLPMTLNYRKGKVIIQDEKQAMQKAQKEREGLVFWTDGSRKVDEWVGSAVIWEKEGGWKKKRVHLRQQKEVFDAEMYAMSESVKIADEISNEREVQWVTILTDSQMTLT